MMTIRLNPRGYEHARALVESGRSVLDERDAWSEHRPSTRQENEFIAERGFAEYGRWHLGIDDEKPDGSKGRYAFPYGDFEKVHRCGVLSSQVWAGQHKCQAVETAAAHLHGLLDAHVPRR